VAKNTDQDAQSTAATNAALAARFERSDICTHGEWVNGKRVLGLRCNCQHALRVFDAANRFIKRLTWDFTDEELELMKHFF